MRELCDRLGMTYHPVLLEPTWNGEPLAVLPPFGGIPEGTEEYNHRCLDELSDRERIHILSETRCLAELAGYKEFVGVAVR